MHMVRDSREAHTPDLRFELPEALLVSKLGDMLNESSMEPMGE